ncbi:hypothetical protein MNBD_ALPHA12-1053 [hydrothermal vent metagenome]|uniref:Uncharacterized protein n=1 Tax=hydrothermal vent metagenome TaxID=652676 RepID=A0A3B0TRP6_9ZZZZ
MLPVSSRLERRDSVIMAGRDSGEETAMAQEKSAMVAIMQLEIKETSSSGASGQQLSATNANNACARAGGACMGTP